MTCVLWNNLHDACEGTQVRPHYVAASAVIVFYVTLESRWSHVPLAVPRFNSRWNMHERSLGRPLKMTKTFVHFNIIHIVT